MIQSLTTKPIVAQTLEGVAGADASLADNLLANLDVTLESTDFASELAANLMVPDSEVLPVKVSPEQILEKPSTLINNLPKSGNPETIQQKVFDPALTNGVENLIKPKTVEVAPVELTNEQVIELANLNVSNPGISQVSPVTTETPMASKAMQLNTKLPLEGNLPVEAKAEMMMNAEAPVAQPTEAFMKLPQVHQTGRTTATQMAQTEIDPQLMNMEDFVTQKNMVAKKPVGTQAYGMQRTPVQKAALENNLKSNQVVTELKNAEAPTSTPVNSQQFILNNMAEQNGPQKLNDVQVPQKVFDMSHVKTSNAEQILNQVSDYIVQAKAAKEPTVSMRVNHDELGMIDITVQKTAGMNADNVAININSHTAEGKNFFQQNSKDLFSHLNQSGINVTDLKLESSSSTAKNSFDMGQQSHGQQSGAEKQFGSEQNQRRHDSNRRQDLWDLLKDKEAA